MARLPVVGPKPIPGDKRRRQALQDLYAELPALECKRLCSESCGPVFMVRVEWQRICRVLGEERQGDPGTLVCPILEEGRCAAYDVRPTICRLWGMVETMKCPWGCIPDRYLTHEEGLEFLVRAGEIGA